MSKHPWGLLVFDSCPSILDDVRWDSINLKASLTLSTPRTYICPKVVFSYHGRIYIHPHKCIFFILPGRSWVFTVVSERSCFFLPFFTIRPLANTQGKRKKKLSWGCIYTSMVAEDHILGYDKNILRSFRQNVLGIERVNDDYCNLISVQASLMMMTPN